MSQRIRHLLGAAFLLAAGSTNQAHAQLAAGTSWLRTDAAGKGFTLDVAACCNGGLRLVYTIPAMGGQPAATMTVDSPMDGTEVPALLAGKPSGQTMAITRVDDNHYRAIVKMGEQIGTFNGTVAADGRTMSVDAETQSGGTTQKTTETWVRK